MRGAPAAKCVAAVRAVLKDKKINILAHSSSHGRFQSSSGRRRAPWGAFTVSWRRRASPRTWSGSMTPKGLRVASATSIPETPLAEHAEASERTKGSNAQRQQIGSDATVSGDCHWDDDIRRAHLVAPMRELSRQNFLQLKRLEPKWPPSLMLSRLGATILSTGHSNLPSTT